MSFTQLTQYSCRPICHSKLLQWYPPRQQCLRKLTPHKQRELQSRNNLQLVLAAAEPAATADPPHLLPLDENYDVAHTFEWYANWLLRGRLMLGRYPFVEPSRATNREIGEKNLSEILDAGITTFVCLQAELPPQEEMKLGGVNGFLPYAPTASLITKSREGPIPMEEVMGLRNQYLNKFLPERKKARKQQGQQQEQAAHQQQQAAKSVPSRPPLQFAHEPITDLDIPDPERLEALLGVLEARLRRGEVVYLHCWGGRGRAGTVGATLLHRLYGLPAEEALERVQRAYSTRKDPERSLSPETDEQRAFVRSFIEARS